MALFRGSGDDPFDADEIDYLATLSGHFARGVRAGMLCQLATGHRPGRPWAPPS